MGKKAIDEKIMNANLPLPVRRMALGDLLPEVEGPKLFSGGEEKAHLLPRLKWNKKDAAIPDRRIQTIKNKVRSSYEKLTASADNPEMLALNSRMADDISSQIESRLKELAEQVEIPL